AHDLFEHRRLVHLLAEREVLVAHALLGALAIVDVDARREPASDAALGVAQRRVAREDPPILSVCSPQAKLELAAPHPFHERADGPPRGRQVVRMDDLGPNVGVLTVSFRVRPVNSRVARFAYSTTPCASPTTRSWGRKSTIARSSRSSCRILASRSATSRY